MGKWRRDERWKGSTVDGKKIRKEVKRKSSKKGKRIEEKLRKGQRKGEGCV